MEENFKAIAKALSEAGLKHSAENQTGKPVDFKITPYSLNTKLSFRFQNLDEFIAFINASGVSTTETDTLLKTGFLDLGLDPDDFFYVNFFEKGKEAEM